MCFCLRWSKPTNPQCSAPHLKFLWSNPHLHGHLQKILLKNLSLKTSPAKLTYFLQMGGHYCLRHSWLTFFKRGWEMEASDIYGGFDRTFASTQTQHPPKASASLEIHECGKLNRKPCPKWKITISMWNSDHRQMIIMLIEWHCPHRMAINPHE